MNFFKVSLLLVFLFFYSLILCAQEAPLSTISAVEFQGIKKFQETYLSRFLKSKPGNIFNESQALADVQRLKNIQGVGNADYRFENQGEEGILIFEIREVKTLLPLVNFGGIQGNFWFRLGFTEINWQGKGQTISAYYQNNDRRSTGQIYYRSPFVRGSNWGYSLSLTRWASREPLFFPEGTVNYDYDNNSLGLTAIRNFGQRRVLEFGSTFFIERYLKSETQFLETPPGPDDLTLPKLLSKIDYRENFLNYHLFYLQGFAWQVTWQHVYDTKNRVPFNSLQLQFNQYIRTPFKGNLAMRFIFGVATNDDSPFAPFVADSHFNLRGIGNRIDRGTAQLVFNVEYRQTIIESSDWGVQLVLFSDLGTWRNPGGKIKDMWDEDQFREFVGGGFRIIYNKIYGAALRVDYGVDVFNPSQRGFVLGLGQYF